MTDKRKLRLMQDALDKALSPDAEQELNYILDTDPEDAAQFDRLQRVEMLLSAAPHERAPERLALTIMARLAEAAKTETKVQASPEITEEMMQTAIQLVTIAALPMLVGAGWMLLNAQSDPEMLETVLYHVAALLMLVIDVMEVMMEKAQSVYSDDPELAMALLTMIPVLLLALIQEVMDINEDSDDREK